MKRRLLILISDFLYGLYDLLFGCRHPQEARSRVWNDDDGKQYQTCFDCGARLEYSRIQFREVEA